MGSRHGARLGRRARRRSGCDHRGMTDWDELLKDLQDRRDTARAMGGTERLEEHRRDGRLDARARVDRLLDDETFVELGTLVGSVHRGVVPPVPADGLIAGHGLIDGRPVLVGAEDFTVMGGSIGRGTTAKRQRLTELAAQERVPLVMLLEGAGERTQNAFEPRGRAPNDLQTLAHLSGLVPTVAVVMGPSAGHGALTAPLMDFVVMVEGASLFSAGPPLVKEATGEDVTKEVLGGTAVHTTVSGVAHNAVPDDREALDLVRRYLGYFPSNAWQLSPAQAGADDTAARAVDAVTELIPADPRRGYDVRPVVELIADRGSVLEIEPAFGRPIVTALVRFGGVPVAGGGKPPAAEAGALGSRAADKGAHFLDVAGAFPLPLLFLPANPGVLSGT